MFGQKVLAKVVIANIFRLLSFATPTGKKSHFSRSRRASIEYEHNGGAEIATTTEKDNDTVSEENQYWRTVHDIGYCQCRLGYTFRTKRTFCCSFSLSAGYGVFHSLRVNSVLVLFLNGRYYASQDGWPGDVGDVVVGGGKTRQRGEWLVEPM